MMNTSNTIILQVSWEARWDKNLLFQWITVHYFPPKVVPQVHLWGKCEMIWAHTSKLTFHAVTNTQAHLYHGKDLSGVRYGHKCCHLAPPQEPLESIPVGDGLFPVLVTLPPPTDGFIGSLVPRQHQVRGDVFALDERTLMIKNFNFDGSAPGTHQLCPL